MNDEIFDLKAVCQYTKLSESSIYKKVSNEQIPFHKIGTRTLFMRDEIDTWVRNDGRMVGKLPVFNMF